MLRLASERLADSVRAFASVFRNPNLRRIELALAGSVAGNWAYGIALAVFAYHAGGATAVGIVSLARMIPSAIAAPFVAVLADRFRRERVMVSADLVRVVLLSGAAAAVFAHTHAWVVYALAIAVSISGTAFHPAQSALLPSLTETPEELTAANVTTSTIDAVGVFVGPAIGGLLLAASGVGTVFAATAGAFLWSALLVGRIQAPDVPRERAHPSRHSFLAGFAAIALESKLRLLVGLYGLQTLVAGALNVLIVVSALNLLHTGNAGVGFLNAASGVGGLAGALAAFALVGRRRLAANFAIGIVLWGLPLALIGVWPNSTFALVLLGIVGVGNTLVDVAALTLLQRAVADDVLGRVFGVLEGLLIGTIGVGAAITPLLIAGLGIRGALIATGAFLPVVAALFWRRLARLDADAVVPERQLALLRGIPIFAPLPAPTLEHLAGRAIPVHVAAGTELFRQGDPGDRFYAIEDGEVEISVDGAPPIVEGPGEYFGEIALLGDVPRTATVRARTDVELYALEREEFVAAVTGHAESASAADAVVSERLGGLRAGLASV
jgi:MFS family permease